MDSLQTGLDLRQPTVDPHGIGEQVTQQDFQKGSRLASPVRGAEKTSKSDPIWKNIAHNWVTFPSNRLPFGSFRVRIGPLLPVCDRIQSPFHPR